MKKIFSIISIISMLYGCEPNNTIFSKEQINTIVLKYRNDSLSFNFSFNLVYTIGTDDSIYISNLHELSNLYKLRYSVIYSDYSTFLYDVLNQKKINHISGISYCDRFKLDSLVMNFYELNGYEKVRDKYCIYQSMSNTYRSKEDIIGSTLYTVSYILFLNGYYSHQSDNVVKMTYHKIIQ